MLTVIQGNALVTETKDGNFDALTIVNVYNQLEKINYNDFKLLSSPLVQIITLQKNSCSLLLRSLTTDWIQENSWA